MQVLARLRECVETMQYRWKVIGVRMTENMNRKKYHLFEQFKQINRAVEFLWPAK